MPDEARVAGRSAKRELQPSSTAQNLRSSLLSEPPMRPSFTTAVRTSIRSTVAGTSASGSQSVGPCNRARLPR